MVLFLYSKATQDSSSQTITSTYIKGLSVSGKTITYTRGDNTTGTITTQDTNTTYSVGTSTYSGTTKLYTTTGSNTDGTMTQNTVTCGFIGFIDVENLLLDRNIEDASQTTFVYTATENCWLRPSINSNKTGISCWVCIDGISVAAVWHQTAIGSTALDISAVQVACMIPLMKGQKVTIKAEGGYLIKVYGMKYS